MTGTNTMRNAAQRGRQAAALLGTALAAGFAPLAAHAQATQITSASGLAAGDTTLTYTITDDTPVSSYTGSTGGSTLTFTDARQSFYESQQRADDFNGAFPEGTNILATADLSSGTAEPAGPLTITFAPGVTQFGLSAENVYVGNGTFTFTPFSGTTPLGTFFKAGPLGTSAGLAFLGARVGTGSITSVQISSFLLPNFAQSNDFGVGPVTFDSPTATPEPSSVAALSLGILGTGTLALCARRRPAA